MLKIVNRAFEVIYLEFNKLIAYQTKPIFIEKFYKTSNYKFN